MATERRRLRLSAWPSAVPALLLLPRARHRARGAGAGGSRWRSPASASDVGHRRSGEQVVVTTARRATCPLDGGRTFQPAAPATAATLKEPAGRRCGRSTAAPSSPAPSGGPLAPDPRSPFLGESAHLIAAPAALPGVAVAVGSDNHVWRRSASGQWATSFILLPAGGAGRHPAGDLARRLHPAAERRRVHGHGRLRRAAQPGRWRRLDPRRPGPARERARPGHRLVHARRCTRPPTRGCSCTTCRRCPAPPVYRDSHW